MAALPADALAPKLGERIPALRAGEAVIVRGFEPARRGSGGGFRTSDSPVPGPNGVTVLRVEDDGWETNRGSEVVLAIWRPFLVYLAVATAVFVPIVVEVLIGAFSVS